MTDAGIVAAVNAAGIWAAVCVAMPLVYRLVRLRVIARLATAAAAELLKLANKPKT
jgi:hypothetical protein